MHPALSVILFSTLSGLGFGLLFFLGLGLPVVTGWMAFAAFTLAFLLAVGGLLASTFHLGHPERALRAFSQWRTSWLSREACASVAALLTMAAYGAGLVFAATRIVPLGLIGAALSICTVLTTSMIYAQLKTVPRWHHWSTPALFLSISLAGGALVAGQNQITLILFVVAAACQSWWWSDGDRRFARAGHTMATATGLGQIGAVRSFAPPHTGSNYLMREMIHQIGRKHALRLRAVALTLGYAVPILILLAPQHWALTTLATLSHVAGILASRWIFFAEAEHVVGLYYGKRG
ncbi:MAG: dimethyl sulfoxide reductase anchor subunit [Rhodobacterales bacterium]|nr:dimethyl sulfoxide reductase anchor subunit [Rhodobacterales bacterium]